MLRVQALLVASVALVGVTRAHAAPPAWCDGARFDDDLDVGDLTSRDPKVVVAALAQATCAPDAQAARYQADVDRGRVAWGKRLGLGDADWRDVLAWIAADRGRNIKPALATRDLSQASAVDQYIAIAQGVAPGSAAYRDPNYVADAFGDKLTQVGRYAYVEACLAAEGSVTSREPPAAQWAMCADDLARFSLDGFHAELRADRGRGDLKMALRFAALDLPARLTQHKADVAAARERDPVYPRLFELAEAARRDWAAGPGSDAALLALALRMDAASWSSSRKLSAGCEADTRAALVAAVGKLPAKAFAAMKDQRFDPGGGFAAAAGPVLIGNPTVQLAAFAFAACQPDSGTGNLLGTYLQQAPIIRGPRTAALARMFTVELQLDDANESIQWPRLGRSMSWSIGSVPSAGGVVAKTKIVGDAVVVTLKRTLGKRRDCAASRTTGRIARINPDGRVEYEQICLREVEVTVDQTWADFRIRAEYAPLLKKGVRFSAVNASDGGPADLIAVWPKEKAETPSWLLGAELK